MPRAKTHLNDSGEKGCEAVAGLPHPEVVEGDAAGGLRTRVSALLVAVKPGKGYLIIFYRV